MSWYQSIEFMKVVTRLLMTTALLCLVACSSYVKNMHRSFDKAERAKRARAMRYQQQAPGDRRPIQNPVTLGNQRNYAPANQRQYQRRGNRRAKAEDFKDDSNDGSLWSGKNSESFLFVTNNLKRKGDIVIIEVFKDMKNKIQEELKRNFPDPPPRKKKTAGKTEEQPEEATPPPATVAPDDPNKVYDKISTTVVEQMNQDYLLVRGRKEVLFKKFKRYFEIQAIVNQKDITSQDTVRSIKLLEPKINVLRY